MQSVDSPTENVAGYDLSRLSTKRQDLLRRFTQTPEALDFQLMGRTVRLETNNQDLLGLVLNFFACYQYGPRTAPDFVWRLVCEPDPQFPSTEVQVSAFSDSGHQFVNFGHRSFLALDLDKNEAIGFLADRFLEGNPRFRHRPPLDILLCMTAPCLGLTALSAACIGHGEHCVLLFGPPNSGKTTTGYLSARLGLDFHGDQVAFVDMASGGLRAWGDPFPAVFRPEGMQHLPELRELGHFSSYGEHSFLYVDKSQFQPRRARPITPLCSVFLERTGATKTSFTQTHAGCLERLEGCRLFREDSRVEAQTRAALAGLSQLPMYELKYDSDPQIAANVIKELLR